MQHDEQMPQSQYYQVFHNTLSLFSLSPNPLLKKPSTFLPQYIGYVQIIDDEKVTGNATTKRVADL